jgi:hypothetical protein
MYPIFLSDFYEIWIFSIDFRKKKPIYFINILAVGVGRDSSVGIATRYGLGGPGIEYRRGRDFPHPSRPALGPIQPPKQRVSGLSRD